MLSFFNKFDEEMKNVLKDTTDQRRKSGIGTVGSYDIKIDHIKKERYKVGIDKEEEYDLQKKYQPNFQNDQLREIEAHLKILYKERFRDLSTQAGHYDNQIDRLKQARKKMIEQHGSPLSPRSLLCMVLVSPYKNIKKNINSILFEKLPKNRYHPKDLKQFRPFEGETNIHAIIEASKHFTEPIRYINYTVWKEPLKQACLTRKSDVVLIADVGSLCSENKVIAQYFDNFGVKGVLVPRCNELLKDKDWNHYMRERVQDTFPNLHNKLKNDCSCSFYHPEPSQLATFKQSLYWVIDKANEPTNRIQQGHSGREIPSFYE